jgi:UDP-N-acetylmuramate-alanine ligase
MSKQKSRNERLATLEHIMANIHHRLEALDSKFNNFLSPEPETGKAAIQSDDCTVLQFILREADPGQETTFSFKKNGKGSWVETVKYSHRNNKKVVVKYDREGNVLSITDALPE